MKRLSSLIFMGSRRLGQKRSHKTQLLMSCIGNFLLFYPTSTFLKLSSLILSRAAHLVGVSIQQKAYQGNRHRQGAFSSAGSLSHCSTTSFGCRTLFSMETLVCANTTLQEV